MSYGRQFFHCHECIKGLRQTLLDMSQQTFINKITFNKRDQHPLLKIRKFWVAQERKNNGFLWNCCIEIQLLNKIKCPNMLIKYFHSAYLNVRNNKQLFFPMRESSILASPFYSNETDHLRDSKIKLSFSFWKKDHIESLDLMAGLTCVQSFSSKVRPLCLRKYHWNDCNKYRSSM